VKFASRVSITPSRGGWDKTRKRRAYGLPYDEALKAVTLYPARFSASTIRLELLKQGKLAKPHW